MLPLPASIHIPEIVIGDWFNFVPIFTLPLGATGRPLLCGLLSNRKLESSQLTTSEECQICEINLNVLLSCEHKSQITRSLATRTRLSDLRHNWVRLAQSLTDL